MAKNWLKNILDKLNRAKRTNQMGKRPLISKNNPENRVIEAFKAVNDSIDTLNRKTTGLNQSLDQFADWEQGSSKDEAEELLRFYQDSYIKKIINQMPSVPSFKLPDPPKNISAKDNNRLKRTDTQKQDPRHSIGSQNNNTTGTKQTSTQRSALYEKLKLINSMPSVPNHTPSNSGITTAKKPSSQQISQNIKISEVVDDISHKGKTTYTTDQVKMMLKLEIKNAEKSLKAHKERPTESNKTRVKKCLKNAEILKSYLKNMKLSKNNDGIKIKIQDYKLRARNSYLSYKKNRNPIQLRRAKQFLLQAKKLERASELSTKQGKLKSKLIALKKQFKRSENKATEEQVSRSNPSPR